MYESWYDYMKPKYGEKAKLCYMDTHSFIVYIKTEHIYVDIGNGLSNSKLVSDLSSQQIFRSEKHNVVTGEATKIAMIECYQ